MILAVICALLSIVVDITPLCNKMSQWKALAIQWTLLAIAAICMATVLINK